MQYKGTFLKDKQYLLLTEFTQSDDTVINNVLFKGDKGRDSLMLYMAEMKY